MANTILIYRNKKDLSRDPPLVRYVRNRIRQNKNFMCIITGKTGSGKTYCALRYGQSIAKDLKVPFTHANVAFDLGDWITLVKNAPSGSVIVFDEPQISISNKAAMTKANRIFNYVASTFRVRRLIVFFCTPFADFIDKSARKLIHMQIEMLGINFQTKIARAKPVLLEYSPIYKDMTRRFIRIAHSYPENLGSPVKKYVEAHFRIPDDYIRLPYEKEKELFLDNLLREAEENIEQWRKAKKKKDKKKKPKKKAKSLENEENDEE